MKTTKIGKLTVSRFLLGGNPFSGFSHQSPERSREMVHYYSHENIKKVLFEAEKLGITGTILRTDPHIGRLLMEYWDEGGKLTWLAQTATEVGDNSTAVQKAINGGAKACHIHGGVMDHLVATGNTDEAKRAVDLMRKNGIAAGIAGHSTKVFEWAEKNLDVDYYMCCYYNPTIRDERPEHVQGAKEMYREEDRKAMTDLIKTLSKPVVHYKILAAGRNKPEDAFAFAATKMRPQDLVCVGVYHRDSPDQLRQNVELFNKYVK